MLKLTPEQTQRQEILFNLLKALPLDTQLQGVFFGQKLWLDFAGSQLGGYDLLLLMKEGLLKATKEKPPTYNSWLDQFPPTAYLLTEKAVYIFNHRHEYVFEGKEFELHLK